MVGGGCSRGSLGGTGRRMAGASPPPSSPQALAAALLGSDSWLVGGGVMRVTSAGGLSPPRGPTSHRAARGACGARVGGGHPQHPHSPSVGNVGSAPRPAPASPGAGWVGGVGGRVVTRVPRMCAASHMQRTVPPYVQRVPCAGVQCVCRDSHVVRVPCAGSPRVQRVSALLCAAVGVPRVVRAAAHVPAGDVCVQCVCKAAVPGLCVCVCPFAHATSLCPCRAAVHEHGLAAPRAVCRAQRLRLRRLQWVRKEAQRVHALCGAPGVRATAAGTVPVPVPVQRRCQASALHVVPPPAWCQRWCLPSADVVARCWCWCSAGSQPVPCQLPRGASAHAVPVLVQVLVPVPVRCQWGAGPRAVPGPVRCQC